MMRMEGCGNVMLLLLELVSIIKVMEKVTDKSKVMEKVMDQSKHMLSLVEDIDNRWQIMYGDGLSQMRVQGCSNAINAASINFHDYYKQLRTLFAFTLNHVVMVPGNLQGGGFHFLGVVCILFHGGFLQLIQFALGWKHI
jgi:hypothetical protein